MSSAASGKVVRSRSSSSFECPSCGVYSGQEWRLLGYIAPTPANGWSSPDSFHVLSEDLFDPDAEYNDDDLQVAPRDDPTSRWLVGTSWASAQCQACGKVSIWRDEAMVHPAGKGAPPPHPDMPRSAKALYEEARSVVTISRRAGAAMARAALERTLRETLRPSACPITQFVYLLPQFSPAKTAFSNKVSEL